MKQQLQMPYREFCGRMNLPYSSFRRWRQDHRRGQPLLQKPGPKKLEPLPLEELQRQIAGLNHGARRTEGAGALHRRFEECISRRDLDEMIRQARLEAHRREREQLQQIEWLVPGVVWSMDALEWDRDADGKKLYAHEAQDLASRYQLPAWVTLRSWGTDLAQWVEQLLETHEPPLIFKRDNGGPFNHPAVDAVLARHGVIPLNNPPHCARYNGAKERGGRDLREALDCPLVPSPRWMTEQARLHIALALHHLNHRPRPCLQGRVPCEVFFHGASLRFRRRERQAIFNSIFNDFRETISRNQKDIADHPCRTPEWRQAVETWLRRHDLIRVTFNNNQEVSTHFDP